MNNFIPKLVNDDFFNSYEDHLKQGQVDTALLDPPYGVFSHDTSLAISKNDPIIDINKLEIALDYLLKPNGVAIIFCDLELLIRLKQNFHNFRMWHHYHLIKTLAMPRGKTNPINNVEYLAVFIRNGKKPSEIYFNPYNGEIGKPYSKLNYSAEIPIRKQLKRPKDENKTGQRWIRTAIQTSSKCNLPRSEISSHPLQKSEKLIRKMIKTYSQPGELIFDGFAGSGSTLISAYKEDRMSFGIEIDEKYFMEAQDRIDKCTKQLELI